MPKEPEPPAEVEDAMEIAHRLLVAALADDHRKVNSLRELDADWWNVAWTLTLLIRGTFKGDPTSLEVLAEVFREAETVRKGRRSLGGDPASGGDDDDAAANKTHRRGPLRKELTGKLHHRLALHERSVGGSEDRNADADLLGDWIDDHTTALNPSYFPDEVLPVRALLRKSLNQPGSSKDHSEDDAQGGDERDQQNFNDKHEERKNEQDADDGGQDQAVHFPLPGWQRVLPFVESLPSGFRRPAHPVTAIPGIAYPRRSAVGRLWEGGVRDSSSAIAAIKTAPGSVLVGAILFVAAIATQVNVSVNSEHSTAGIAYFWMFLGGSFIVLGALVLEGAFLQRNRDGDF